MTARRFADQQIPAFMQLPASGFAIEWLTQP
jgi:hypothetical protein